MKRLIAICLAFCSGPAAFASGGMIGGGDVTYKSIMECEAEGVESTHSGSPYVWVVKEVDFDGNIIEDATLRVVTLDDQKKPVSFYVSHATELVESPDQTRDLDLWRYDIGSSGNFKVGKFQWNAQSGTGSLSSIDSANEVEELQLRNCEM